MNSIFRYNYFPVDFRKKDSLFFYVPYFSYILWILSLIFSLFVLDYKRSFNLYLLISISVRLLLIICGIYLFFEFFIKLRKEKKFYNIFKAFVGYGVVLSYVFGSLPRMVLEFNNSISFSVSLFFFIVTLITSIFPSITYIFLRSDGTRLILEIFNKKELEYEKKVKKDKKLKKEEHEKLKKERTFLENLWYEWIDVIIQAIIIALIIQQFVFQMYQIPSESMVPTFLVNDRVIVNKFIYGPHIPLTEWKLPLIQKPKIGDIVVFKNPEMDDPSSEIRYKNAFVRIFHPFIYMLSLSLLDIDKKSDGSPKERFIVKRLIAKDGEKICILNDKVYKKYKDSEWIKMEDIKFQKEYGQNNIYYEMDRRIEKQKIIKELRDLLNKSEELIEKEANDVNKLNNLLLNEKKIFLDNLKNISYENLYKTINNTINKFEAEYNSRKSQISFLEIVVFNYNFKRYISIIFKKNSLSSEEILKYKEEFIRLLNSYYQITFFDLLNDFKNHLTGDNKNDYINYFENNIIEIKNFGEKLNPYDKFMKRYNGLYKIYKLKLYNEIINMVKNKENIDKYLFNIENINISKFYNELYNYFLLVFYCDGYGNYGENEFSAIFSLRNFPEYPQEENVYFNNEYFVLGDNRYNSYDMRFGRDDYQVNIDKDDSTDFGKKVIVSWKPHTIKERHILGKAIAIYFPLDRIGFLK